MSILTFSVVIVEIFAGGSGQDESRGVQKNRSKVRKRMKI